MTDRSTKSYLYEGAVIVASILVAFGLDASWASYQDSIIERRVLGELHDELETARDRVISSIAELEGAIAASYELAEHIGRDTAAMTPAAAERLFNEMLVVNTLEVPKSVLDSIIASGQVRLISSKELRKALSEWPAFDADVRENHEWHRVATDEYLVPYMARHVSIRNSVISFGGENVSPGTLDHDILTLQRDAVFEGRLLWNVERQWATLDESNILLDETEKLLALIALEAEPESKNASD